MGRVIKEFKLSEMDKYDFRNVGVNSPVFFNHVYTLENICGKVVHISERRRIVNIEFTKLHRLHFLLTDMELDVKLDLVHTEQNTEQPRLVEDFVVYLNHGYNV